MKVTFDIPFFDAVSLGKLLDRIRKGDPSTAALVEELKKHDIDISKVKIS